MEDIYYTYYPKGMYQLQTTYSTSLVEGLYCSKIPFALFHHGDYFKQIMEKRLEFARVKCKDYIISSKKDMVYATEFTIIEILNYHSLAQDMAQIMDSNHPLTPNNDSSVEFCYTYTNTDGNIHDETDYSEINTLGGEHYIYLDNTQIQCMTAGIRDVIYSNSRDNSIISSSTETFILVIANYNEITCLENCPNVYVCGIKNHIKIIGNSGYVLVEGNDNTVDIIGNNVTVKMNDKFGELTCLGNDNRICVSKGTVLTCSSRSYSGTMMPHTQTQTIIIDGNNIKEDTFYIIKNGQFEEIKQTNKIQGDSSMSIKEWLQKTNQVDDTNNNGTKDLFGILIRPMITCHDGFQMSVQASKMHHCSPADLLENGEYQSVEVGRISKQENLLLSYAEDSNYLKTVYDYVPVETVDQIIQKHGGIKQ